MTLLDINRHFSNEKLCRELLTRLRWPNGPECPRCKDKKVLYMEEHDRFLCGSCRYQFSVTSGTIFNDSHLPLNTWFVAVLLMVEARKGISANQMKRTIGVAYKTAWYLCHRIREAMSTAAKPMLNGTIEMDETFVGGKARGRGYKAGKEKEIVIGLRQRGGPVRFFHAADAKAGTLAQYIKDNISQDFEVLITDEMASYPFAMKRAGFDESRHKTINHHDKVFSEGDIYTNTVENSFSLLKRGIVGSWHKISAKHLPAYLAEMEFRFNRRDRKDIFIDTLKHMVNTSTLTFEKLTA